MNTPEKAAVTTALLPADNTSLLDMFKSGLNKIGRWIENALCKYELVRIIAFTTIGMLIIMLLIYPLVIIALCGVSVEFTLFGEPFILEGWGGSIFGNKSDD